MLDALQRRWRYLQFGRKQQQAFLEDLLSLIKDGVPVSQAIDAICDICAGITQQVAEHVNAVIIQGKPLADGLQGWFSRPIVEIIRAGETSGTLISSIESATQTLTQQTNALLLFINATLYPLTVVSLALGVSVFIKQSVLVSFAKIKPVDSWPGTGQTLYHLAQFTQDWWWLTVITVIVLLVLLNRVLHNLIGPSRKLLDTLPLLSLYRDTTAARFMETLGLLMSNGVVLKKALSIMQLDAEPYLTWHLLAMEFRLSGGTDNVADVLDTQLIKHTDLVRLRVVAKGKGVEHALISLGRQAHQRNNKTLGFVGKTLGAVLLITGAAIAATLILGIYTVGSSISV